MHACNWHFWVRGPDATSAHAPPHARSVFSPAALQWVAEALPGDKAVQRDLAEMNKAMQEESAAGFLGFDVATNPLFRCGAGPLQAGWQAGRQRRRAGRQAGRSVVKSPLQ